MNSLQQLSEAFSLKFTWDRPHQHLREAARTLTVYTCAVKGRRKHFHVAHSHARGGHVHAEGLHTESWKGNVGKCIWPAVGRRPQDYNTHHLSTVLI